jgi:tripartite-type tricarboxylate transporter receptor subunit TctC
MAAIRLLSLALIVIAAVLASPSDAQNYPDRPIKLIVTVAAGGPMDTIARVMADQLQSKLGQPVVVENRPGAGSTLGAKAVASATPDGYTLMWGTLSTIAIAPALYKDPGYDPKAFVPIAMIAEFPHVMVISPTVPAHTMREFVAYKGGAPSIPDLLAGRLQMQFDALTLLQPLIKDGKVRALAVASEKRWPGLPEVPTLAETGFTDFPGAPWAGLMAPSGTPEPIVAKLNAVTNDILRTPQVQASLGRLNVLPRPGSQADFAAFVSRETPVWTEMVRASGATAE